MKTWKMVGDILFSDERSHGYIALKSQATRALKDAVIWWQFIQAIKKRSNNWPAN